MSNPGEILKNTLNDPGMNVGLKEGLRHIGLYVTMRTSRSVANKALEVGNWAAHKLNEDLHTWDLRKELKDLSSQDLQGL